MKAIPIFLAIALAPVAQAEQVSYSLDAEVRSVFSLGGTTDVQSQFHTGDQISVILTYETDTPGINVNLYDAIYDGALVDFSVEYSNGFAFESSGGYMKVTDDYPSWDSIGWEVLDQGGVDEIAAPLVGNAKLVDAAASLIDTTRMALGSKALVPLPAFTAFTGSYLNLAFLRADGTPGVVTYVNGRIRSLDQVITRLTYSCMGFRSPMDLHPVTIEKFNRALPLKASMYASDGSAIDAAAVIAKPVVAVSYLAGSGGNPVDVTSETYYVGQGDTGSSFVFEDGEWKYNLKGGMLSAPGTYTVRMISPDQNEYVIEPECVTSVVIK